MNEELYNKLKIFTENHCPKADYFCNGRFIPDRPIKGKDLGRCQYYGERGCTHWYNPKNRQVTSLELVR